MAVLGASTLPRHVAEGFIFSSAWGTGMLLLQRYLGT